MRSSRSIERSPSMSKQKTASLSLLSLPTPPKSKILVADILIDANRLNGTGIFTSSVLIFLSSKLASSTVLSVPDSLEYPPKM